MNFRPPKGTDDVLPPASRQWRETLLLWENLSRVFGYDLVLLPMFEATDLFTRGVGESTEVVGKQMYTFEDRKGRSLTLRPEGTASAVRSYLAGGSGGELKLAYSGPMFRYERPQAGRRRQFHQVGVEYLGSDSPEADAEIIEMGFRFVEKLGLRQVEVALNSIGDHVCRPGYLEALNQFLSKVDLCEESRRTAILNPLRVLDCKVCVDVLTEAPRPIDHLCDPCRDHHNRVMLRLDTVGIPHVERPLLVRGLDYYTRTAFEYLATNLNAAQNAVGGGGRYDGLAEALGGPRVPGVGLAMGIDRLLLALGPTIESVAPLELFLVIADRELREEAARLASDLRREGVAVDMAPSQRSVKAQFRVADRRGASRVVIVGEEWNEGLVPGRDLVTGQQTTVKVEEVAKWAKQK